eukprot:GHVU01083685.1.p1 GENE.GHVU01083685.1~~GHVU01083685.1.p1  ORF type:complete len:594 (+),score=98.69 GHVU01083685.1:389-2170(+)
MTRKMTMGAHKKLVRTASAFLLLLSLLRTRYSDGLPSPGRAATNLGDRLVETTKRVVSGYGPLFADSSQTVIVAYRRPGALSAAAAKLFNGQRGQSKQEEEGGRYGGSDASVRPSSTWLGVEELSSRISVRNDAMQRFSTAFLSTIERLRPDLFAGIFENLASPSSRPFSSSSDAEVGADYDAIAIRARTLQQQQQREQQQEQPPQEHSQYGGADRSTDGSSSGGSSLYDEDYEKVFSLPERSSSVEAGGGLLARLLSNFPFKSVYLPNLHMEVMEVPAPFPVFEALSLLNREEEVEDAWNDQVLGDTEARATESGPPAGGDVSGRGGSRSGGSDTPSDRSRDDASPRTVDSDGEGSSSLGGLGKDLLTSVSFYYNSLFRGLSASPSSSSSSSSSSTDSTDSGRVTAEADKSPGEGGTGTGRDRGVSGARQSATRNLRQNDHSAGSRDWGVDSGILQGGTLEGDPSGGGGGTHRRRHGKTHSTTAIAVELPTADPPLSSGSHHSTLSPSSPPSPSHRRQLQSPTTAAPPSPPSSISDPFYSQQWTLRDVDGYGANVPLPWELPAEAPDPLDGVGHRVCVRACVCVCVCVCVFV